MSKNISKMKGFAYKIIHYPITRITIGLLIVVPITIVFKDYVTKPLLALIFSNELIKEVIQHLVSITIMVLLYYLTFKILEKRPINEIWFKKEIKYAGLGLLMGILAISVIIAILYIPGYYQVMGINSNFSWPGYLLHIFVAALWEEVVFRGIAYRIIEKWLGTVWALVIPSIFFGVFHLLNDDPNLVSVLSATSGGLLAGILFTYRKNIWLPVFFHFSWNFTQLAWGSMLSGNNDIEQFLIAKIDGPTILTGGANGIENSIFVFVICTGLFLFFLIKTLKDGSFIKRPSLKKA
jgi:membrane protease YdiL (CAAX protease family)